MDIAININCTFKIIIDYLDKENGNESITLLSIIVNWVSFRDRRTAWGSNSSRRKALTILLVGTDRWEILEMNELKCCRSGRTAWGPKSSRRIGAETSFCSIITRLLIINEIISSICTHSIMDTETRHNLIHIQYDYHQKKLHF